MTYPRILRYERELLVHRLRNEEPIKWITATKGQRRDQLDVFWKDWEQVDADVAQHSAQKRTVGGRKLQASETQLDCDFPKTGHAEELVIRGRLHGWPEETS